MSDVIRREPETNRLLAIAQERSVAAIHAPQFERIAVHARLIDFQTNEPSEETLLLDMHPGDAFALAQVILSIVKERGWKFEMAEPYDRPGHPRGMN